MLMQLGDIVFERLHVPESWETAYSWTFADIPRIGGKPGSQPISPDLDTHSISGKLDAAIHPDIKGDVAKLRDTGLAMKPIPFMLGDGTFVSMVTIRKLTIAHTILTRLGSDESLEFTIELTEYVETEKTKESEIWS